MNYMVSATTMYAALGVLEGAVVGHVFAGSNDPLDLAIGAFLGVFIGILLAMGKHRFWGRVARLS